jgi:hypothetical protein
MRSLHEVRVLREVDVKRLGVAPVRACNRCPVLAVRLREAYVDDLVRERGALRS